MRIAHIGPSSLPIGFQYGGAVERRMIELAKAQAEQGDEVAIFSVSPDSLGGEGPAGTPGKRVDIRCRTRRPFRDVELPVRSRAELRSFRPDLIHVHNNWSGARALTGLDVPTALSFDFFEYRGSHSRLGHRFYDWAIDGFDLLLPVSEHCADGAADHWRLPRSCFDVLPNGVNVMQFRPDAERRTAARRSLGFTDDDIVVGYVGRVCEQKGTDLLVPAFRRLHEGVPATRLLVAGPTGQFGQNGPSELTDQIEAAGGRWLGPVSERQLADIYRVLDIFAMPTRQWEMFGMAAAEALASGTPVVCSDLGGLPEVVSSDAGLLVTPGDSEALADALLRLSADQDLRADLSAAAPGSVDRFAWEQVADTARRLYSGVAAP